MEHQTKIAPEEIHLFHIEIVDENPVEFPADKKENIHLNAGHSLMYNLKEQQIKIGLHIHFGTENNIEQINNNFVIDFHFKIENLNNFYKLDQNNNPLFSPLLITTLLGLSFSTARGIIFEKLYNADNSQNIILPIIDPKKLFPNS